MASGLQTLQGQRSVVLGLHEYLVILKDLEDLLTPSFGPCGRQVLITTRTGPCMVSKDGKTILDSFVISHPITNWVVDHVRGHYGSSGDNSKSFILLFMELLRRVKACHLRQGCQQGESSKLFCLEIAQNFTRLAVEVLPSVLISSVSASPILLSANLTDSSKDLAKLVNSVIFSTLQGNLPQDVAKHLRSLTVDFIQLHLPFDLNNKISFILKNFRNLCQEVSGYSVADSHIIDGVLIPRDFAFCADTLENCDNGLKILLIACDFVTEHMPSNTTITLSSVEQISQAAMSNQQRWSRFVARLLDRNVDALIAENIVPDHLLAMCRRANISVIHSVCAEDLSSISQRSGQPVMYDLEEDLEPLLHDAHFIRRTILGKEVYSCVGIKSEAGKILRDLVICGPTAAICRSYSASVQNALKALQHCLDTPIELNPRPHTDGLKQQQQEKRERSERASEYLQVSQVEQSEGSETSKPLQGMQEVNDKLYAVYGGGAIEQITSNALHRFSTQSTDEQLRLAAAVFAEALEIIPQTLHNNSCSANMKGFLSGKARTVQERGRCMGISARSGAWVPAAELGIVDPLGSKLALWQSVLRGMCELLRIDSVLGVRGTGYRN